MIKLNSTTDICGNGFDKVNSLADFTLSNLQAYTLAICTHKRIDPRKIIRMIHAMQLAECELKEVDHPSSIVYDFIASRAAAGFTSEEEVSNFATAAHAAALFYFANKVKKSNDRGDVAAAGTFLVIAIEFYSYIKINPIKHIVFNRSVSAKHAVKHRHKNDPKQAEKELIRGCYEDWQAGRTTYKTKAAFVRDMAEKCIHLTVNYETVRRWIREGWK